MNDLIKKTELFKNDNYKELAKEVKLPKEVNSLFLEAVKNYDLAKSLGDNKRIEQFKEDALQCIFMGNGLLRCKIKYNDYDTWQLERYGFKVEIGYLYNQRQDGFKPSLKMKFLILIDWILAKFTNKYLECLLIIARKS